MIIFFSYQNSEQQMQQDLSVTNTHKHPDALSLTGLFPALTLQCLRSSHIRRQSDIHLQTQAHPPMP